MLMGGEGANVFIPRLCHVYFNSYGQFSIVTPATLVRNSPPAAMPTSVWVDSSHPLHEESQAYMLIQSVW